MGEVYLKVDDLGHGFGRGLFLSGLVGPLLDLEEESGRVGDHRRVLLLVESASDLFLGIC